MPHIAENIKRLRSGRFTQEQLAVASGISSKTIRNIENGGDVRLGTAQKIADALGVPLTELLNGEAVA